MNAVVRSQSGFSLVDVLISLFILGIVTSAMMGIMLQTREDQTRIKMDSTRLMLIGSLRFNAGNSLALKRTALADVNFKNCACGYPSCENNKFVEVSLKDVSGAQIAGISSSPQYFDTLGNRCDSESLRCPWVVTARFKCVGESCGKGTFAPGDPMGVVTYRISLSETSRSARKEWSYFKNTEGVPVNFSFSSLRVYASEICP